MSKFDPKSDEEIFVNTVAQTQQNAAISNQQSNKITFDQIASVLLKQNYILTALEFHTELAESGRELPRLRDYFSNPSNFEQSQIQNNSNVAGSLSSSGFYPLHKASSIQTFDSLDLTRYSDDVDQNKLQDDKIAVLEFELRKAKETINQLRATLTIATENQSSNMSKSSLNANNDQAEKSTLETSSNNNSKSNILSKNPTFNIAETEDDEENDDSNLKSSNGLMKQNSKQMMPHDKNAINFLINEYLLENDYKMTSVTFAEENESQDLEDWDVVGLNRSKPPSLFQLYKLYLNKTKLYETKKQAEIQKKSQIIEKNDFSTQTEITFETTSTNTVQVTNSNFECQVNFDRETFENQKTQIKILLEKQEILLKSISKFESEISVLNSERESHLKKIDLLTVSLEKVKKMAISRQNSIQNGDHHHEDTQQEISKPTENSSDLNERKIPIVFKELLNNYSQLLIDDTHKSIVDEMSNLKLETSFLLELVYKYLPKITRYVQVDKRLELLPLLLTSAILQQEEFTRSNSKKNSEIINLLFNLIDNPNSEQRAMIITACIQYTKYTGPLYVNNFLLPQCWEQLNDKIDERRILVAEACAALAPYIYNDIRSSLMFSILKQLIEQETSELVKVSAIKSLALLINHISDENKFQQCIELLDLCATDTSDLVIEQVEEMLMPSISLWSLGINKFSDVLVMHLIEKAEYYLVNNRQKYRKGDECKNYEKHAATYMKLLNLNIQFIFAFVLIHFRESNNERNDNAQLLEKKLPKLNSFFHTLQERLDINLEFYKIDSILEDYLTLTVKYLDLIESDSWSSVELSKAFEWLSDRFIRKMIQMSAQVDAKDVLCQYFVKLFRNFTLLFAIDFELVKSKIIPIFEKLLNVPESEFDATQQSILEQALLNKACPLYKSTLPVYFVGILSTLVDIESYGWFNLNANLTNDQEDTMLLMSESSPSTNTREKVMSSSNSKSKNIKKQEISNESQTSLEKRIDHMTCYLKNIFFALSLNQSNLDGVISIYELMKLKSKTSDYVTQMLLSTLWDGIVHISLYVRCNTAKLFEILVTDCNEYLLSTRILPALITLANDLDKMVRCSSISPLTSIIENCENKEILERVYTQLQSFLSDPILKDEYLLQIELLKTFRRISIKVNSKFREEFILPYLTILTINIKNMIIENDYEFTLSEVTSTFLTFSSLSPVSLSSSSSNSSMSSTTSLKENMFQIHQSQQQDIIKICVLLFDTYQSICFSSDDNQKPLVISRQSIQESLLPGLSSLRDIFHDSIIINANTISSNSLSNNQNDYVKLLDSMIHKIEAIQPVLNESNSSPYSNVNSTPSPSLKSKNEKISPLKVSPGGLINDFVNMGSNVLSSSSTSSFSSTSTVTSLNQNGVNDNVNGNLKQFVFKGFSNLKDQSKDKFSNFLLSNKTFKK